MYVEQIENLKEGDFICTYRSIDDYIRHSLVIGKLISKDNTIIIRDLIVWCTLTLAENNTKYNLKFGNKTIQGTEFKSLIANAKIFKMNEDEVMKHMAMEFI